MRRPARPVTAVLAVVLVAAAATVVVLWLATDMRRYLDLESLLDPAGGSAAFVPGAHLATDRLCGPADPCVQAVASETALIFKYGTREEAAAAAASWGADGYHSHWIAVHFLPGGLSERERQDLVQGFDESNTESPD